MRHRDRPRDLTSLDGLVSPYGLVSRVGALATPGLPADFCYWKSEAGAPGPVRRLGHQENLVGSGQAWDDPGLARFVAVAEVAERYAGRDVLAEERIWATAEELGDECLEPERYPRCTEAEYAHPDCPIVPFDPRAAIRWTSGLDLVTGEPVWVPAVLACYGLTETVTAEHFSCRMSTGFAVHTDPVEAVVRGLFEVVERDANAVVWLQRLALPPVDPGCLDERLRRLVGWCRDRFKEVHLFDATSDLGVPTVYCVVAAEYDPRAHRVVGASSARDLTGAAHKALLEALGVPQFIHFVDPTAEPVTLARLRAVGDTTRYMGRTEHAHAFDFLLEGADRRTSTARPSLPADPSEALADVVGRLAGAGMRPVVVDRTTRELADVGLTAVNVVVPDLQPMSVEHLIRFTAHPRLYEAPARMGYRVLPPAKLNPWPQPMA
ncbi:YcaO-like family protein [Micromonospora chokoriensis]|uniref:Ribosomal protein S12 methylthiotransferase accessory factor n=1 Tax=Micromonospora chokoriensis TaxID=356851 RepID=A0A1C4UKP5_9ACTN|nr:YcaO-like family protein [Micromonospora chokoriensis]SCE72235.1 ribosomal protein S12 methylthiotransferase accessory factor [Micromonospora chokoriensis]